MKEKRNDIFPSFTLVELLVVIAIIGILAAAVIFGVSNARDKAAQARAMSDCSAYITAQGANYADGGSYDNSNDTEDCTAGCCAVGSYVVGMTPPNGWTYACDADQLPKSTAFTACKSSSTCAVGSTTSGDVNGSEGGCKIVP